MTPFFIVAALLSLLALAWVLVPLLRPRTADDPRRDLANLAILRDQLAELDRDLQAGVLSDAQYAQAKEEIERRVLDEVAHDTNAQMPAAPRAGRVTAVVLALAIPLGAALMYWRLGTPDAMVAQVEAPQQFSQAEIETMVAQLAERMQQNPDDPRGWAILGRTYYVMGRYTEAAAAYEQLLKRVPPDADVLADYADALAMAQGRKLTGEPMTALRRALEIDPNHWKALALIGTEAFERKDYKGALAYWEKLLAQVPPDSEIGQQIAQSVADARELAGVKAPAPVAAAPGAAIGGTIRLAPDIAAKTAPTDTVFVFARAAEGPRMPLAALRMQVKDLPASFTLDDSMAMTPAARLGQHKRVVVSARVSKSGDPTAQSGDLAADERLVDVGDAGVALTIDKQLP